MEVLLWRQSNRLVGGEKIWEAGKKRDPDFTCANMFWWYNMASSHDVGATPRPIYKADGRKLPDCYTVPADLRERLTERLGAFPLFQFWGPATTIASTRWIAEATKLVMAEHNPTLTLAYLPHLDYDLQRFGPDETHASDRELLPKVRSLVEGLPGVEHVYGGAERGAIGLDHVRSGELIAMADARSWFTYYYWKDDSRAPDFARTVEIHRKPGYDPVELFLDPSITLPKATIC